MIKSWHIGVIILLVSCAAYAADVSKLEWDASNDADYYVVYWSKTPGGFTEANSMDVPANSHSLDLVPSPGGVIYYYTVKAFTDCGNSSDFSELVASAHIPLALSDLPVNDTPKPKPDTGTVKAGNTSGGGCFIESLI